MASILAPAHPPSSTLCAAAGACAGSCTSKQNKSAILSNCWRSGSASTAAPPSGVNASSDLCPPLACTRPSHTDIRGWAAAVGWRGGLAETAPGLSACDDEAVFVPPAPPCCQFMFRRGWELRRAPCWHPEVDKNGDVDLGASKLVLPSARGDEGSICPSIASTRLLGTVAMYASRSIVCLRAQARGRRGRGRGARYLLRASAGE
eukprot:365769-Chlamydomonas_euryale.AAC.3